MQYKIIVDKQPMNNPSEEKKEYIIDIEELRRLGDVYDSLTITLDKTYVTRRLQLSQYGVLSVLSEPIIENLDEVDIELFEGDNYVYLYDMQGNHFYAEYLIKNEFTDLYVTVNQMNSSITQSAQSIEFNVSQTLQEYSTTEEMNSAIQQTASEINLEVSKKVGEDEVISKINQSAEQIQINANKISLEGKTINLTSDDIVISSNNFNVTKNGNMNCKNGSFSGNITGSNISLTDNPNGSYNNAQFRITNNSNNSNTSQYMYITSDQIHMQDNEFGDIDMTTQRCAITNTNSSSGVDATPNGELSCFSSNYVFFYANSGEQFAENLKYRNISQISLESEKKNIVKDNKDYINIIKKSNIYNFNYKNENDNVKKHIGFIIGENYSTPTEIISKDGKGIDLTNVCAILWKAIQEQQQKIEQLEQRLKKLEEKEENNG